MCFIGMPCWMLTLPSPHKTSIMAQDSQAQAIRRRKAATNLAKWKEAEEASPAKAAAPKKKVAKAKPAAKKAAAKKAAAKKA